MLIDTHTHLGDKAFDPDRDEAVARAFRAGIGGIVEIADSPAEWDRALALCARHPGRVFCCLGLHPYHADQWSPELAGRLEAACADKRVVGVGEIGLDYARCELPAAVQKAGFIGMIEAARRLKLPIVVHCRDAYEETLEILRKYYVPPPSGRFHGVLHCFSGLAQHASAAVKLGFALGADGPVTYPKNDALRAALKLAGLESLVLETDCPYLPPQSIRGKRNEPYSVLEIARTLSGLFQKPEKGIAGITTGNARDLFPPLGKLSSTA